MSSKQAPAGLDSLEPLEERTRAARRRLSLRDELLLAALPTVTMLVVLAFVEFVSEQRLLFASLASSAFLIYLDPEHGTNRVRTLVVSQIGAAALGWLLYALAGPGYLAAGAAMVAAIGLMIVADAVHPPAVATAMSFALRAGDERNVVLFGIAVAATAVLVLLQRAALWIVVRAAVAARTAARPARRHPRRGG